MQQKHTPEVSHDTYISRYFSEEFKSAFIHSGVALEISGVASTAHNTRPFQSLCNSFVKYTSHRHLSALSFG